MSVQGPPPLVPLESRALSCGPHIKWCLTPGWCRSQPPWSLLSFISLPLDRTLPRRRPGREWPCLASVVRPSSLSPLGAIDSTFEAQLACCRSYIQFPRLLPRCFLVFLCHTRSSNKLKNASSENKDLCNKHTINCSVNSVKHKPQNPQNVESAITPRCVKPVDHTYLVIFYTAYP